VRPTGSRSGRSRCPAAEPRRILRIRLRAYQIDRQGRPTSRGYHHPLATSRGIQQFPRPWPLFPQVVVVVSWMVVVVVSSTVVVGDGGRVVVGGGGVVGVATVVVVWGGAIVEVLLAGG
jgi:hypothetical protein